MTAYTLRRAQSAEAPVIVAQRRAMFEAMGYADRALLDAMDARFGPWLAEKMASGDYLGWFAVDAGDQIVAGAGLWLMDWPPHALDPAPRRGNILNVYVHPAHRRRGLARRLMDEVLSWCRQHGLRVVILHASVAGRPLYASLGFEATNEMRLMLAAESGAQAPGL